LGFGATEITTGFVPPETTFVGSVLIMPGSGSFLTALFPPP
jgi:hypothetical protein